MRRKSERRGRLSQFHDNATFRPPGDWGEDPIQREHKRGSRVRRERSGLGRLPSPDSSCYGAPVSKPAGSKNLNDEVRKAVTRRYFFRECAVGVGAIALATLLRDNDIYAAPAISAGNPLAPRAPHFAPKAKRV